MRGTEHGRLRVDPALLDELPDIVAELETDGRIVHANRAVLRIFGVAPEFLVGHSFVEVAASEDRDRALAAFRKAVETGSEQIVRFQVPRGDRVRTALEAVFRVFERANGRPGVTVVCRDVTEHASTTRVDQLRQSQHRALVETGLPPTAIATPDGQIQFANRRFRALFGAVEHVEGLVSSLRAGSFQGLESTWYESTREAGSQTGQLDVELPPKQGIRQFLALRWTGFRAEGGERLFMILALEATPQVQLELALEQLVRGLDARDQEAFAGWIASLSIALGLDRLALLRPIPEASDQAEIMVGWQDGRSLAPERVALGGLPEEAVARGELCVHPRGVGRLLPAVGDHVGPDFESFAGVALIPPGASHPVGILSGYARRALVDPERIRHLFGIVARPLAALLTAESTDRLEDSIVRRYDAVLSHVRTLAIELDTTGHVHFLSNSSESLLGRSAEDCVGRTFEQIVAPESIDRLRAAIARVPEPGEEARGLSLALRHARGSIRRFHGRLCPSPGDDRRHRWLLLLTEQPDARRTRRTGFGNDLLLRVFRQSADFVFVCAPNATLLFANERAERHLGVHGADGLTGLKLLDLFAPQDAGRLEREVLPRLVPHLPWTGELLLAAGIDGIEIPTEATLVELQDPIGAGEPKAQRSYLVATLRDMSQQRRVELALRESEARLSQARKLESVGRLAGGIAHDFNNLLTAIVGYSDLVLHQLETEHAARPDVEEILRAAERAGGLTRQLLTFSRRQALRPGRVDLNAVVADIDRMLRRLIGEDIELVTTLDGELDTIVADPGQLEQVVVNLVVNARDAMRRGGRLEIETENVVCRSARRVDTGTLAPGDYVVLRVRDAGTGIDAETRHQIFEPFFTTKSESGGTGLGLASVAGIVSEAAGEIEVDSEVGVGTCFHVYFPADRETQVEIAPEAPPLTTARGDETVLVIEDSATVRRLVERTLAAHGYTVLSAESVTAALRHCSRHEGPIDLLLCDVVLPRMAGPELAQRARQLRPEARVLFMSGFTDETLEQHGLRASDPAVLAKPFNAMTLLSRVRNALDQPGQSPTSTAFLVEQAVSDQRLEE